VLNVARRTIRLHHSAWDSVAPVARVERDDEAFAAAVSEIVAALDEVPFRTLLLDEHGIIRWQNRASLALRGSRRGRHFTEITAPADAAAAHAAFESVLTGDGPVEALVHTLDANNNDYGRVFGRWNAVELRDGTEVVVVVNLGDALATDDLADRGAAPAAMLTRRQFEVLRLLDAGHSTAEIAQKLTLTPTTVRNHIANLLGALGAHSRLQAVAVARAWGILAE
jgi:DNA-binding CsgD family transcriptional regulator